MRIKKRKRRKPRHFRDYVPGKTPGSEGQPASSVAGCRVVRKTLRDSGCPADPLRWRACRAHPEKAPDFWLPGLPVPIAGPPGSPEKTPDSDCLDSRSRCRLPGRLKRFGRPGGAVPASSRFTRPYHRDIPIPGRKPNGRHCPYVHGRPENTDDRKNSLRAFRAARSVRSDPSQRASSALIHIPIQEGYDLTSCAGRCR